MCVYRYTYAYTYTYTCIYIYTHVYIYIYICVYSICCFISSSPIVFGCIRFFAHPASCTMARTCVCCPPPQGRVQPLHSIQSPRTHATCALGSLRILLPSDNGGYICVYDTYIIYIYIHMYVYYICICIYLYYIYIMYMYHIHIH